MVIENNLPKAYKEVLEIVNHMSKRDYDKVDKNILSAMKNQADWEYDYKVEHIKDFQNQEMLLETKYILAIFFRDYWATERQRNRILEKERIDTKIEEKKKQLQYSPNDIFKNKKTEDNDIQEVSKNAQIVVYKETIINKCINFIKKLFKSLH